MRGLLCSHHRIDMFEGPDLGYWNGGGSGSTEDCGDQNSGEEDGERKRAEHLRSLAAWPVTASHIAADNQDPVDVIVDAIG